MASRPRVRLAEHHDARALAHLRARRTDEVGGALDGDDAFADEFETWLRREWPRRTFWVAEVDGTLVGMVNLLMIERMPRRGQDNGRWGYLGNLYVAAEHRGTGAAQLLVDAVLTEARRVRLDRVLLSSNDWSVTFWRGQGFETANSLLGHDLLAHDEDEDELDRWQQSSN